MPRTSSDALAGLVVWLLAGAFLWWTRLPGRWRRAAALLTSGGGLIALILAINTEGVREASTVGFLLGTPYVTEQASASASLPYYLLTGIGLLLGTAALAVADDTAARLGRHWLATAITLSLLLTAIRFTLEKAAAPRAWTWAAGITFLAPLVGAFFAMNLREQGKGFRQLAGALLVYAYAARGAVAALMLVASKEGLGSHYDVSSLIRVQHPLTGRVHEFVPGSLAQILSLGLIPQLVVWPLYTLLAGLLGGGIAWTLLGSVAPPRSARITRAIAPAPAREDR